MGEGIVSYKPPLNLSSSMEYVLFFMLQVQWRPAGCSIIIQQGLQNDRTPPCLSTYKIAIVGEDKMVKSVHLKVTRITSITISLDKVSHMAKPHFKEEKCNHTIFLEEEPGIVEWTAPRLTQSRERLKQSVDPDSVQEETCGT